MFFILFQAGYLFIFWTYNTLRTIGGIFLSNFFQSYFSHEYFIHSKLYFSIKNLILVILSKCFLVFSWFNASLSAYRKHLLPFLYLLLSNWENPYMLYQDLVLFCDICNTMNQHDQRWNCYLSSLFLSWFEKAHERSDWKRSAITSSALSLFTISVITFWMH